MSDLNLEVGKFYRTRHGIVVKILTKTSFERKPFRSDRGGNYTPRGKSLTHQRVSQWDLIRESNQYEYDSQSARLVANS